MTRNFNIFATDLSTQALRTARQAVYSNVLGASIPFGLRQEYTLTGHGSQTGRFRIVPELRTRVTFDQVNLIASGWNIPGAMDIVFCRNVMIYFDRPTQGKVLNEMVRHLPAEGYLFLGHSENICYREFPFVPLGATVYTLKPKSH